MQTFLIFILFLGPLVFFHELGHFLFARLFGVRVEVFSIGFGPKIFKKKWGDTEYAISIIPLGGYVKMFGDNPLSEEELSEEEKRVAFTHKSKWAKFWIVFGGPLANFILAFFLYLGLVLSGEKVPEAKLGNISPESPLYQQGLRSGDVVLKINEHAIVGVDDFNLIDSKINTIVVNRFGTEKVLNTSFDSMTFIESFSDIRPSRSSILVNTKGEYHYLSLSEKPSFAYSFEELVNQLKLETRSLYISKITSKLEGVASLKDIKLESSQTIIDSVNSSNIYEKLQEKGFFISDLSIYNVALGSSAASAGLQKNDIIVKLKGQKINRFEELKDIVSNSQAGESLVLTARRGQEEFDFNVTPKVEGDKKLIGVQSGIVFFPSRLVDTKSSGFLTGVVKAFYRTKEGIAKTAIGFKKLIFGEVSIKHIGGPFQIASVAADSFQISLSMFFRLMALISINLGLINLFPIPVLDGGHILMLGAEVINRGPLPKKALMRLQQFGVSILFLLMFVAIANDISKLF